MNLSQFSLWLPCSASETYKRLPIDKIESNAKRRTHVLNNCLEIERKSIEFTFFLENNVATRYILRANVAKNAGIQRHRLFLNDKFIRWIVWPSVGVQRNTIRSRLRWILKQIHSWNFDIEVFWWYHLSASVPITLTRMLPFLLLVSKNMSLNKNA